DEDSARSASTKPVMTGIFGAESAGDGSTCHADLSPPALFNGILLRAICASAHSVELGQAPQLFDVAFDDCVLPSDRLQILEQHQGGVYLRPARAKEQGQLALGHAEIDFSPPRLGHAVPLAQHPEQETGEPHFNSMQGNALELQVRFPDP